MPRTRRVWVTVILLVVWLASAAAVRAREVRQGDQCVIDAETTIEGNLFALCRTLLINGRVTGNVIGAATSTEIQGSVDGDLYLTGGTLDIRGTVGEDIHFAGVALSLYPTTALNDRSADLNTFSLSTTVMDGADVSGSVVSLGYQLVVDGTIDGEMSFWGSSLTINGLVGGDVNAEVGDSTADVSGLQSFLTLLPTQLELYRPGLSVGDGAAVEGLLSYAGPTEGTISSAAAVADTLYTPVRVQPDLTQMALEEEDFSEGLSIYSGQVVREFLTLAAIGLLALVAVPRTLQAPLRNVASRPLPALAMGMLSFIIAFVVALGAAFWSILLLIGVNLLQVGELTLAVALILLVVNLSGSSTLFFLMIFGSRVVLCLALGRAIVRVVWGDDAGASRFRLWLVSLLIGVGLVALIASLPLVGWIINALAAFVGLGAILMLVQQRMEAARENANAPRVVAVTAPVVPRLPGEPRLVPPPPPVIEDLPRPLGMENLPDGFRLWED